MEKEKLLELLKKAKPEKIELPESKAKLRRELLNSEYFLKKTKFALRALAVTIVILILLITDFTPREISAKEIINKLDDLYSRSLIPGKVNYSEGTCIVYGENEQTVNFKFENWRDSKGGKVKFIRKDLNTDEILDFKIFDGPRIFCSPDSRMKIIKIQNIDEQDQKINSGIGNKFSYRIFNKLPSDQKNFLIKLDSNNRTKRFLTVTINENDVNLNGICDTLHPRIYIYSRFIDVDEMNMETPRDIVARLKAQPEVTFLGSKFEEKLGKKVMMLQKAMLLNSPLDGQFNIRIEI
jgi:hypothetical protein